MSLSTLCCIGSEKEDSWCTGMVLALQTVAVVEVPPAVFCWKLERRDTLVTRSSSAPLHRLTNLGLAITEILEMDFVVVLFCWKSFVYLKST